MNPIPGLHHVTAIAGEPQPNVEFWVSLLGLRLVKRTVNFDDPSTYHLYYGDDVGTPGTILTFFPWPGVMKGRRGAGQTTEVAFAVPAGSLDWWMERLAAAAVDFGAIETRFGERVLGLNDPDGLAIELVEQAGAEQRSGWKDGPVPERHAIRGFHGVTLTLDGSDLTAKLLTEAMGYRRVAEEQTRTRYASGHQAHGALLDLVDAPGARAGLVAGGTVHHIAFRCASDADQKEWQAHLAKAGMQVTPVQDRQYFHSIYYREPGGVLFEIATDPPGFTLDETREALGTTLKLPPWLEPQRASIEQRLPPLRVQPVVRAT